MNKQSSKITINESNIWTIPAGVKFKMDKPNTTMSRITNEILGSMFRHLIIMIRRCGFGSIGT
jgi:hypothetical protein